LFRVVEASARLKTDLQAFLSLLHNAQVQGRALGMAEACGGGGVPCNAQLGRCQ